MSTTKVPAYVVRGCIPKNNEEFSMAFDNYVLAKKFKVRLSGALRTIFLAIDKWFVSDGRIPTAPALIAGLRADAKDAEAKALELLVQDLPDIPYGPDFTAHLRLLTDEEAKERLSGILSDASEISHSGKKVRVFENGRPRVMEVKGVRAATSFLIDQAFELLDSTSGSTSTTLCRDVADLREEYLSREADETDSIGILTGFETIDIRYRGFQPGDVALVAGFAGNGKSTMCMNFAHQAMVLGYNVLYLSLEMQADACKRALACIHSGDEKFQGHPAVLYNDLRTGSLNDKDRDFFLNTVLPDLGTPGYGDIRIECPSSTMSLSDVMAHAETVNRTFPIDLLVIDYIGLIKSGKFSDYKDSLNQLIRDVKQWAMSFDGGRGVPILTPFQCNRHGYEEARKNQGVYEISALSHANEAERTADFVIAIYAPEDERALEEAVVTCLKFRDAETFSPMKVYAGFPHKIFGEMHPEVEKAEMLEMMI